jgi:hypothetical protein
MSKQQVYKGKTEQAESGPAIDGRVTSLFATCFLLSGAESFSAGTKNFPAGAGSFSAGGKDFPAGAESFFAGAGSSPAGAGSFSAGAEGSPAGAEDFPAGGNSFLNGSGYLFLFYGGLYVR